MKKNTTNNLVTININGVSIQCTQEQAIAIATACGSATPTTTKTSAKSSAKKTATTKSSKSTLADFEPKKDADGQYNYKSWKTCRRNYVSNKVGKDLTKEWIDYADFCKAAAPFDKKFPYVKKADR